MKGPDSPSTPPFRIKTISASRERCLIESFVSPPVRSLAEQLVDPIRPGCFNQALMELGAIVCTPTSPNCSGCPVSGHCQALNLAKQGAVESVTEFPGKKVKKAPREETVAVCVVELQKGEGSLPALKLIA